MTITDFENKRVRQEVEVSESVVCFAKPISVTDEGNRYEVHTVGPYCNNESMIYF